MYGKVPKSLLRITLKRLKKVRVPTCMKDDEIKFGTPHDLGGEGRGFIEPM